jgi:predicted transposase YbfD/YdcC
MSGIMEHFGKIPDPRIDRKKLHKLHDIIFITIAAVISGADDWEDIEDWGNVKLDWLKTILELPNGIPSHDTFNRVFSLIDPAAIQQSFTSWVQSIAKITNGQVISLDGKRLCNSGEHGEKSIIHMVSAWSNANNMVLAQQKINDKSNEITAIPALLDVLSIEGCMITIDAMGCQKAIAEKIVKKDADYILAVKDNQQFLHDDIKEAFGSSKQIQQDTQLSMGHGRIEKRTCKIIKDTSWVCNNEEWETLKTLICVESERTMKATGIVEKHTRYFISSKEADANLFNKAIREHWGIENKLHWTLDVAFGEDSSNKRAGHAAENFSFISKVALNVLKQHDDYKGKKRKSIKTKRKKAGWDNDYLAQVLAGVDKIANC